MDRETKLRELITQKDVIQSQIKKITASLDELNQTKQFDKGLVDREGFPRSDLDFGEIANYRNLKRRKEELNNDHAALMKQIEKGLFELHATYSKVQSESQDVKETRITEEKKTETSPVLVKYQIDYLTPFAVVTLVEHNSPAELGGIRVGDLLSEFAEVNIYTLDNIKQIPRFVKDGLPIDIVLMRKLEGKEENGDKSFALKDGQRYLRVDLKVTPTIWEGKGLLGCKFNPL